MTNIKFTDTSKLIMAICSSILKDENKTLIVSPDEREEKVMKQDLKRKVTSAR